MVDRHTVTGKKRKHSTPLQNISFSFVYSDATVFLVVVVGGGHLKCRVKKMQAYNTGKENNQGIHLEI